MRRSWLGLSDLGRAGFLILLLFSSSSAKTLSEVLQSHHLPTSAQAIPDLRKAITSYKILDDEKVFLIAYYLDDGSGFLKEALLVSRFDKLKRTWRTGEILHRDVRTGPVDCLRSVTRIDFSTQAFYVGTHLNPSAGCTIVVSHELLTRGAVYGWFLGAFSDGSVVYHNSQVHFAPIHFAEISIYDPERDTSTKIYPMKPYQAARIDHLRKVQAVYGDEGWCRKRNHHCDPDRFDNHLASRVEISDATRALAFVIKFDNKVYWSKADRWRLEGFRELRRCIGSKAPRSQLSDLLFSYLYADLNRVKRLNAQEQVLEIFNEDLELQGLLEGAFAGQRPKGQRTRAFFSTLDPRWEDPAIWKRLTKAIEGPPEFTEVVYVYQNVINRGLVKYKEMLLGDLGARFGDVPLRKLLEQATLKQIFGY